MGCECILANQFEVTLSGVYDASIDGSTTIEISDDTGLLLIGSTVSTLNISAYAFKPDQDPFLRRNPDSPLCSFSASASIPWITKFNCETGETYFIPKLGAKASTINFSDDVVDPDVIKLECKPGIINKSLNASVGSGPTTPITFVDREDGYNLVYKGGPIPVNTGIPQIYTIDLGKLDGQPLGKIKGFLQSFSLTVNPPDVARVQYSFVFTSIVPIP